MNQNKVYNQIYFQLDPKEFDYIGYEPWKKISNEIYDRIVVLVEETIWGPVYDQVENEL